MKQPLDTRPKSRRLNIRALIVLGVVVVGGVASFFALRSILGRVSRDTFLDQARHAVEEKRPDDALRYINEYLRNNPSNLDGLELKSKILSEAAREGSGIEEAMRVQNQILALDPGRKEARKRQIELNIRAGQYRAAQVSAEEYLKQADDADAHRLMGQALEGVAYLGDVSALDRAIVEYEKAEAMQPGDVAGGLRLALLYRSKGKDPKRASEVMEGLLKSNPKSPQARLARFRFFLTEPDSPGKRARAMAELDEAIRLAPGDSEARIMAADLAMQTGDTAEARRHLAAINPPPKNDLPIKLLTGLIELREQREDAAIESWRSGLVSTGGSDVDLTWRLAQLLLARGRIREAEPLMAQYRRLTGGAEPSPEYRFLRALELTKTGRAAEAVKELEAISDKISRNYIGRHLQALGEAYELARDEPKALEAYRRATLTADAGPAAWLAIARIQLASRPADSIITLERGLAALPNEPGLLATLAQVLWRQEASKPPARRDWAEFERWIEKAEKAAPKAPAVTIVRADYLAANGRGDEAVKLLQAACERSPTTVEFWLARATQLSRLARADEAIAVLGDAVKAAGDVAAFRTLRARILLDRGESKAARDVLVDGLDRVPSGQKPAMWKAIGEYHQAQRDYVAARRAFDEWTRLQPESAEPHLALLNLAIASGDVGAMESQVDAMKAIGGTASLFWKVARCGLLLQDKPDVPEAKARQAEAEALVKEIKAASPLQPSGYVLEGQLMDRMKRIDDAITAYRKALDLRGGQMALRPLVMLLLREKRDADLESLHRQIGAFPTDLEKLAGTLKLQEKDPKEAERLARQFVQGDPRSLDAATWQAYVLKTVGKAGEAEESLKAMTRRQPEDAAPWLSLLMFQISRKDTAAANATIDAMKRRVKSDRPELLWATCYRVLGSKPLADDAYEAAIKRWPDDATVGRSAADYYELTGRPDLAERSLRRLLKVTPGLDWARRRLAMILSARANDPAATAEAMAMVVADAKGADSPDDRLTRAIVLSRSPDPRNRDEAIRILESLASEIPNSAVLHDTLARSLLAVGRKAEARDHAAKAAAAPDATADSLLYLAGLALADADFPEVEKLLARLTAIDPKSLSAIELAARLAHAKGDDAKAVAALRAAFDEHKAAVDGQDVGIGLLKILMALKLFDAADALGRDLAALGSKGKIAFAEYLGGRGKLDEARAVFDAVAASGDPLGAARALLVLATEGIAPDAWLAQADRLIAPSLKARPDSVELLLLTAYLRRLQGNHPEEIRIYEDVLNKSPTNLLLMNNLAWTLSEDLDRPKDGLARIETALKKLGPLPHLLDTRGVILLRLGKVDEAINDLETAAAALPTAPLFYHLARAYRKAGKAAEFEKYRGLAIGAGLKPEQLQASERDEASKLIGFAATAAASKP